MATIREEQIHEDFDAFYARTHHFYWSVVQHILRQHEESDDTLQNAYFKLWRKWNDAPTIRKERDAWAYTTVRNCAIDRWRRLHHSTPRGPNRVYPELVMVSLEHMNHDFEDERERDPEENALEEEHEQEQHEKLASVLERLSTPYRVLLQCYCSDLPYKVVNQAGTPSTKIKMRKYRAIQAARKIAREMASA